MRKVIIVGATSRIAQEVARKMAAEGDKLFLTGRNEQRLERLADDLKVRGASDVKIYPMDVTDYSSHASLIDTADKQFDGLDTILIAHGTLADQKQCEHSFEQTKKELEINCLSTISLLTHIANKFEEQGKGTIAVISSVAGDRGRQSNYVYGTAKGALNIFMQGLRNRLQRAGVQVLTIKPGFVDTPMTTDFSKGLLWSQPEKIANDIHQAIKKNKSEIYTPWFWRPVMMVIKSIPGFIFNRLKL